ncbi:MAG: L-lactate permease [Nitrospirota bacterium]
MQNQLPITLLHWIVALLPILVLLFLLVFRRWKGPQAGPVSMFTAWAIALLFFRTPFETLAVASAKGVWDAIFILYVIWPALLLYKVADRAGAFEALRLGIRHFSRNRLFLVLAFGWVFVSFLQGIAGFGVPIAVAAPLLVAIGVRPLYAVAIALIGHAWANMFGTLAVGWLATIKVVELENVTGTAFQAALLLWIPDLLAGFTIAWLFGRMSGVRHAWPLVLIISLIHGGGQLALVLWNPVVSTFIPATVALGALYPLSRWERYSEPQDIESDVMQERKGKNETEEREPVMGLWMSVLPYIVLAVSIVIGSGIPQVESILGRFEIGLPFPETTTGYGLTTEATRPYSPFSLFTHPGTYLLLASLIGWAVYRAKGYYRKAGGEKEGIWSGLTGNAIPASIAVTSFLVLSKTMDDSGQTNVLAFGISAVSPPLVYAFFANWIGIVGAFITSSNTASNILFSPLHDTVAQTEQALSQTTLIAAQSTGGAIGNAIAPANIILGTSTTQQTGKLGEILKMTLPWAAVAAVLTGIVTVLINNVTFVR